MKQIILTSIALLGFFTKGVAQQYDDGVFDVEKYKTTIVEAEFNEYFAKDGDREDFKRLREFLREKEDLLDALRSTRNMMYYIPQDSIDLSSRISTLADLIVKGKTEITIPDGNMMYESNNNYDSYNNYYGEVTVSVDKVKEVILKKKSKLNEISEALRTKTILGKNINIVKKDIYDCRVQIDSALAPEYKKQEFRTNISIYFTILIGILLFVFFFIVYKKSDMHLSKELLSGNGLQFITLFVLIIAVILFGILSILQSSELAAILSGISGYILGKGVPKREENNKGSDNKSSVETIVESGDLA